jgi:hypothetical protein
MDQSRRFHAYAITILLRRRYAGLLCERKCHCTTGYRCRVCAGDTFGFALIQIQEVPTFLGDALEDLLSKTHQESLGSIFTRHEARLPRDLRHIVERVVTFANDATEEEKFATAVLRSFATSDDSDTYSLAVLQTLATRINYMIKYFATEASDFTQVWRSAKCPLCEYKVWGGTKTVSSRRDLAMPLRPSPFRRSIHIHVLQGASAQFTILQGTSDHYGTFHHSSPRGFGGFWVAHIG